MNVQFATCEPKRAAEYIRTVYPNTEIPDAAMAPLLELVKKDAVRVQDPMMYGNRIGIMPSKYYAENKDAVGAAVKVLLAHVNTA
jgi:hypothetical protein